MLLKAGADASCLNTEKKSPLDVATINRESAMIAFLNEHQLASQQQQEQQQHPEGGE